MLRLSTEYIIQQIETLVSDSTSRIGQTHWTMRGVECRRERHGHSGQYYSFDLDILNLRTKPGEGPYWELFVVTEFWRSADGTSLHGPKWLKLTEGKAPDVLNWIKKHREERYRKSTDGRRLAVDESPKIEVTE
jgi:hypothetical protein